MAAADEQAGGETEELEEHKWLAEEAIKDVKEDDGEEDKTRGEGTSVNKVEKTGTEGADVEASLGEVEAHELSSMEAPASKEEEEEQVDEEQEGAQDCEKGAEDVEAIFMINRTRDVE